MLDGSDGILIFEFMRSVITEANLAAMSDGQLHLIFRRIVKKSAPEHFVGIRDCSRPEGGGVSSWPGAVQYQLRSYGIPQVINGVLASLRDLKQKSSEMKRGYGDRFDQKLRRCGGVLQIDDRISLYIEGPLTASRPSVSRLREANQRAS